jgi:hemoglobin
MSDNPLMMNPDQKTLYERVGGDETFQALVDAFYRRVEADDVLRPMFPDDLEPGKHYQFLFLTQYWGGPARYQQERGHPRLRMRHNPFAIDQAARDAWVGHMKAAIAEVGIEEPDRSALVEYFERAATFMINRPADPD